MVTHMKTTIDIADELLRQAKKKASAEDRTLKSVVEEALRTLLSARPARVPKRIRPVVVKGTTPLEEISDVHRLILDTYAAPPPKRRMGRRAS